MLKIRFRKIRRDHFVANRSAERGAGAFLRGLLFRYQLFGLQASNLLNYSSFAITTVIGMDLVAHVSGAVLTATWDAPAPLPPLLRCGHHPRQPVGRATVYLMKTALYLFGSCRYWISPSSCWRAGTWLPADKLLAIAGIFALLLLGFETLHLAVYYLLQPYSPTTQQKAPPSR